MKYRVSEILYIVLICSNIMFLMFLKEEDEFEPDKMGLFQVPPDPS